jgi:selenocysteine-specific elongation factor
VVTFLSGTAESEARVRLLDAESLGQGESAWAQVVLADEVAVLPGDRCILRTPNETVAGGPLVAVNPRRHRRFHEPTLAALAAQLTGTPEMRLADLLAGGPLDQSALGRRLGTDGRASSAAADALVASGRASLEGARLYGTDWLSGLAAALEGSVSAYLGEHTLKSKAPREHLRSQLKLASEDFEAVLSHAVAKGLLVVDASGNVSLPGHTVTLSERNAARVEQFLAALEREPYSPPTTDLPAAELLDHMEESGLIVPTRAGVVFAAGAFAEMQERALEVAAASGQVTLAEVRDLFGTSRKYAQAFLEHLDDLKLTRRVGDARVLRER